MILVNGQERETVAVTDRGLQYGDGLFETLAIAASEALCLRQHLQRLADGCRRLAIPLPDPGLLTREIQRVSQGVERGVLKILITRGSSGRGYSPPLEPQPTRLLLRYPWPAYPSACFREGVSVRLCRTRLGWNPSLAGLKHLNRLEQVLASQEWAGSGDGEGLMLDTWGHVVEGTMSNLFWARGGRLMTPALRGCGVEGIIRQLIMEYAGRLHQEISVGSFLLEDLLEADEIFLCNSLVGIWPVCRFAGRTYPVGSVTRQLQETLVDRGAILEG